MIISLSFGLIHKLQRIGEASFMQQTCIQPITHMNVEHDFLLFLFMKVSHLGGLLKLTLLATGIRCSAQMNFGTRPSARNSQKNMNFGTSQISEQFINFGKIWVKTSERTLTSARHSNMGEGLGLGLGIRVKY